MWWKQNQHPWSWRQASSEGLVSAGYLQITHQSLPPKNSWCTQGNFTWGFAFNDTMQCWHCCDLFAFPCNSPAESFLTVALWLVCAGRKRQQEPRCRRTELSSKVSIPTSAPHLQRLEEEDPLWNTVSINVPAALPGNTCILRTAEKKEGKFVCPRDKPMSLQIQRPC